MQSTSCTAKRTRAASSDLNLRGVEKPSRTWPACPNNLPGTEGPTTSCSPWYILLFQHLHVTSYSWCLHVYIPEEVEHRSQKELSSCRRLSLLLRHKALGLIFTYLVGSRSSATELVLLRPKAPAVIHEALRME